MSISYELAKELKEGGFPMKMTDHELCAYQQTEIFDGVCHHVPTLSELIEACGNDFDHLEKDMELSLWRARSWKGTTPIIECGSTTEEAVARLWLFLNKKTESVV